MTVLRKYWRTFFPERGGGHFNMKWIYRCKAETSEPRSIRWERREQKWRHRVRAGKNKPKLSKFSQSLRPFGKNSSRFEGKTCFRCENFQELCVISRKKFQIFFWKMGALGIQHTILWNNMWSLGEIVKNMGSLGEGGVKNWDLNSL